jgi:hypothetical protein
VAGSCEYGDEPSGTGATELAVMKFRNKKMFRYGIPAYTGSFRAPLLNKQTKLLAIRSPLPSSILVVVVVRVYGMKLRL